MKKEKKYCVQCSRPLHGYTGFPLDVYACAYPDCPNFGLLTIGVETKTIKK